MNVELKWEPHPKQREFLNRDERFRVLCWGRRTGKNEVALIDQFRFAVQTPDVTCWWVAPSYGQANDYGFDRMVDIIPEALLDGDPKRSAPREIDLINGTTIIYKSAEKPKNLKGGGVDHVVVDESASIPSDVWYEYLRPTLSDTMGDAVIISTPKGKGWFYERYQAGKNPEIGDHWSSHATSYANPHVPDAEIDGVQNELPTRIFEQEYLAKFREDGGTVFTEIPVGDYRLGSHHGTSPYSIGVDFARFEDWTAIVVLDTNGSVVHTERTQAVSWAEIQRRVEQVAERYSPCTVRVDATRDNKITEDLAETGLSVEAVSFSGGRKRELIENLAAKMERGELEIPTEAEQLQHELRQMEYSVSNRGYPSYDAPEGETDDLVDALALAADEDYTTEEAHPATALPPVLGSVR